MTSYLQAWGGRIWPMPVKSTRSTNRSVRCSAYHTAPTPRLKGHTPNYFFHPPLSHSSFPLPPDQTGPTRPLVSDGPPRALSRLAPAVRSFLFLFLSLLLLLFIFFIEPAPERHSPSLFKSRLTSRGGGGGRSSQCSSSSSFGGPAGEQHSGQQYQHDQQWRRRKRRRSEQGKWRRGAATNGYGSSPTQVTQVGCRRKGWRGGSRSSSRRGGGEAAEGTHVVVFDAEGGQDGWGWG